MPTPAQEAAALSAFWTNYYRLHPITVSPGGIGYVGFFTGLFSSGPVVTDPTPTSGILTFHFINGSTMSPMAAGVDPAIGSVVYEECTDYTSNPLTWTILGTSTDASSDFALPFVCGNAEYMIDAIPYDTSGNPIVFTDPQNTSNDGSNDAIGGIDFIPVPEPSTLVPFGIGAIGFLGYAWRRRKQVG